MKISVKKNQLLPTFDYTITVLNRLKSPDSATKQDVWYKSIIQLCAFTKKSITSVSGATVSNGALYVIRIPKQSNYLPYSKWRDDADGNFTLSNGDYIIKGIIAEKPTTSTEIQEIYNKYRENACKITFVRDNTETIELIEHYHVEGV